jgi:hypothetical protein
MATENRRRGRPKSPLRLSDEEREALERYARRRTLSQGLALTETRWPIVDSGH